MSASVLGQLQDRYGRVIDDALRSRLNDGEGPADFAGMMSYQVGHVDEHLRPQAHPGGKRFRPLLCLLACEATGGDPGSAVAAATAIEVFHNFSLVHDDIEDRDPTRRHRPTVWKVWGEPHAINVGDGMFAIASRTILDSSPIPETALAVARRFQDTARVLTQGQYLDMQFESRLDVRPEEYLTMIAGKTAALVDFSLWTGALLGGADDDTLWALSEFGVGLGKAFQIQDDIAGIWAPQHQTGKQQANDLQNRKKTLPVLIALSESRGADHDLLEAFLSGVTDDLAGALEVLDRCGARSQAEDHLRIHLSAALAALRRAHLTPAGRRELEALAEELTSHRLASS